MQNLLIDLKTSDREYSISTRSTLGWVLNFFRMTFREVKAHAIFFLLELEKRGKISRSDSYQGILNAIAGDVRSKNRRRVQRQNEKANMEEALKYLDERKRFYEEQINSYHDYVEGAMSTMQRNKG
jgi:Ras GTPase-activating-like protein IQGAP2/3